MTTPSTHAELTPTVHVTERSDGHFLPFVVGIAIFAISAIVSILLTGAPQ